ncbi:SPARC-related modular calcium-binding protein 1-like [Pleurodeles waltl]|uniref:SPARC-related modular calcium-binding protein 1-like n=1 Tax=Pleurodeles waltl TaxID=8319 RepID=UPI003709A804
MAPVPPVARLLLMALSALAAPPHWDRTPFIISESDRGVLCTLDCIRERQKPICGTDGKLYKSFCAFQRAKCQDLLLESVPRAHCASAEANNVSLTKCQEDRAVALSQAQARRHSGSIYVPECSEDGSFLQVQCHKQTGYCWCSTADGKPVSGTSVVNQTPNCTGSYSVKLPWTDPNSSKREEGARLRPTEESKPVPASNKQEEGTLLPILIPIIIPDFKPGHPLKRSHESPLSCEQERREALEDTQNEGAFIPECDGDGSYKSVQCHQATGYCWCTRTDTGRPIPGTSTRNFPPDCDSHLLAKTMEMGSLYRERALPGCPGSKKVEFLTNLLKALASDMAQSKVVPLTIRRQSDGMLGPTLEDRAVRWHFIRLDKDFSNSISEKEMRPLKLYMKKNTRPKRCIRKFMEYCDLSNDKQLSLHELKGCLGLS